jgi:lysophospholipase L1-like esterase
MNSNKARIIAAALILITFAACKTKEDVTLHIIGDSTMADYVENTTRTRGWGEMLQSYFSPKVKVANYARGGRSSHSFYKEGLWQVVTDSLQAGDYVLIQFAHNDEKEGGKDGADGRGTAPWTTYKTYIGKYVDEARAKNAIPVFVTPIIRRYFMSDGTISPKGCHDLSIAPDDSTLNYVRVMKHVAREKNVQLVDMTASTKLYSETLGREKTVKCIYVPTDGTHTQATGAAEYALLAAEGLKEKDILAKYIQSETQYVVNPSQLDFKTIFAGEQSTVCFDLTGVNLLPSKGIVTVTAPDGMLIADDPHAAPRQSLSYAYSEGKLWNKCFYLTYCPTKNGKIKEYVTLSYGGRRHRIPVRGMVCEVGERVPTSVTPDRHMLRGLTADSHGITIEGGKWSAEIDEHANRYVEVVVPMQEQTMQINSLSFRLDGGVAYRVACAYGKDFYPRTDLGELQQPQSGTRVVTLPMNVTLKPGQRLHIRLFPWSTQDTDNLHFSADGWKIEGSILR